MKKYQKALGNLSAAGATLSIGALAFVGSLAIASSLPLAGVAFFLAITVEGAVYRQNILVGLLTLVDPIKQLSLIIADRELKELKKQHADNLFIRDYFAQKDYLHALEETHGNLSSQDEKFAHIEMKRVQDRLEKMRLRLIHAIRTPITEPANPVEDAIQKLTQDPNCINNETLQKEIKLKMWFTRFGLIASVLSGICAGLVTLSSMQTCLLTLGFAATSAFTFGAPLAILAGIGFAFLMYRTVTDMIQHETFTRWKNQIIHFLKTERNLAFYGKVVGLALLVGLAIFATIATAGTWWYLVRDGAAMLDKIPEVGANIISGIVWAAMIIPSMLFEFVNGVKSSKKIIAAIKKAVHDTLHELKTTYQSENIFQFLNPFRAINKVLTGLLFIGHLISTGFMSDQVPWLNPCATTSANAAMEGLTDLHYVADPHHNHQHEHDHATHGTPPKESQQEEEEDDDHTHTHGDLILRQINNAFLLLSTCWDCAMGNTWAKSKAKFFEVKPLPKPQPLSDAFQREESENLLKELETQYQQKGLTSKSQGFKDITAALKTNAEREESVSSFLSALPDNIPAPLKEQRTKYKMFQPKMPRSQQCIETWRTDPSYQAKAEHSISSIACSA